MTYPPPSGQDPYGNPPPVNPYAPQPPAAPDPYSAPPAPSSGSPYAAPSSGSPYQQPPVSGQPYGQPYGQQPYQQPVGAQPGYPVARPQNTMALVAMILAIAGLLIPITAPIGAILGHMAIKQVRQTGEEGEGMAKAGIIVGWIITGLWTLGCLCGIGLPLLAAAGR
ncbi:DUF4190 domain-containing protein [Catellatospora sp. KI3]|uniref:DUF4190 domain-containing protein n=1 Tax=Catellatospora sp. KI3 TaxID=3041620 RepID=UPI0024822DC3|nr:DUF4190 domain-containing protein [Catellatospora sp. KI3]MDI1460048.1 DUF4190 domain-containing protein [Catellatospora sp. KI3]